MSHVQENRVAIIGAGPIGLEAAVAFRDRGFDVKVFERGLVADSVRRWGHVRMFSPFRMNASEEGLRLLTERGLDLPEGEACLTGADYAGLYLEPLAHFLDEIVVTGVEVAAISRPGIRKGEFIQDERRKSYPFELLLRSGSSERAEEFHYVLDCSGTFQCPNPLGAGGGQTPGEASCRDAVLYGIADPLGADRERCAGRKIMVIGAGHSAATVIWHLVQLKKAAPETSIIWVTRSRNSAPCRAIPNDPLPEREALARAVNAFAVDSEVVEFRPGQTVRRLEREDSRVKVTLQGANGVLDVTVDTLIAATGFRPCMELARELQVQTCYATEGTYKLAAALLGEAGGDCLAIGSFGAETLRHPEPGYFALGMKSYGRTPDFLIQTGREQVAAVMQLLDGR